MKKTRFFLISLILSVALVSCTKKPGNNTATVITPDGNGIITIENNGGNVTCEEVSSVYDCDFKQSSGRMDYDGGDGGTYGPITWTTDGKYVSWTSTVPVKIAVIVKGGPNANVYFSGCDEYITSGTALSAPINPNNGKVYGLSNITFCYTEAELVIALKSYMTTAWACTGGGESNNYFIAYEPFIPGVEYPLYWLGQKYGNTEKVGNLIIGNFDDDDFWEVKITSLSDLKFTRPYLFVGTVEEFSTDHYSYPYPLIKELLEPPLSEVIIDLPF